MAVEAGTPEISGTAVAAVEADDEVDVDDEVVLVEPELVAGVAADVELEPETAGDVEVDDDVVDVDEDVVEPVEVEFVFEVATLAASAAA